MSDKVIVYGIQLTIKTLQDRWEAGFFNLPWRKINQESLELLTPFVGFTANDMLRFKELHELGYLPLKFKA